MITTSGEKMGTMWKVVIRLVYFFSGLTFGLLGGVFLFVALTNPMERYWNNIFKVTLPAWQWCIMSILTFIPVIIIPVYTAIKKKRVHTAFPLFLLGVFLGSLIYVGANLPIYK